MRRSLGFVRFGSPRGEIVPAAAHHTRGASADVLDVEICVSHPVVRFAACAPRVKPVRQDPPLPVRLFIEPESLAADPSSAPARSLLAACIVFSTHATLRFCDLQRTHCLRLSASGIYGSTWRAQTRASWKNRRASPRAGISGASDWFRPLIFFAGAYRKRRGAPPRFPLPQISSNWAIVNDKPGSYATARRLLATAALRFGVPGAGRLALHSPRGFYPTCSAQLGHPPDLRRKLGRWA